MRLIPAALLLVFAVACAPDTADSGPSYPGWALEAEATGEPFVLEAGNVHEWALAVASQGTSCVGCTVQQQAQVAVTLDAQAVDEPASVQVALVGDDLRVEREVQVSGRESVLLVGPLFQRCSTAPACDEDLRLEIRADAPVRGSWSVGARAESTHDAEDWRPAASLDVRVR